MPTDDKGSHHIQACLGLLFQIRRSMPRIERIQRSRSEMVSPLYRLFFFLKFHDDKEGKEAFKEMVHIMENTIKLRIPVRVDADLGSNWAECK